MSRHLLIALAIPLSLAPTLLACGDKDGDEDDGDGDGGTDVVDADSDGFGEDVDCDDSNADVNPDAAEICDGIDNDCDELVDDADDSVDLSTGGTWYTDGDDDGYGDPAAEVQACEQPAGTSSDGTDCDDSVAEVNPAAAEICDALDNDCDELVDDADDSVDLSTGGTWYADVDEDDFGDPDGVVQACTQPDATVADGTDCDDEDPYVNPDAAELCDGVDNDCDSATTEDGMASWQGSESIIADWTSAFSGSSGSPADVVVDDEGTLWLCDGTFHANIEVTADATIAGLYDGAVIDATGGSTAVWTTTDGIDFTVQDLAVVGGGGGYSDVSPGVDFGGGINCAADSAVTVDNVDLSGGTAFFAAGFNSTGCDTTVGDSTIHDNAAEDGVGGALLTDGTHLWTGVEVTDNVGPNFSGGVYLYSLDSSGPAVSFEDVVISGNSTDGFGGGLWADAGTLEWTATTDGASALVGNTAGGLGGGVYLTNTFLPELSFDNVDFGTDTGGDDNSPEDLYTAGYGYPYLAGDGSSFSCVGDGCGTAVTYDNGDEEYSETLDNYMIGNVILADTDATIQGVWMGLNSSGSCTASLAIFSTDDPDAGTWTLEGSVYYGTVPTSGGISSDYLTALTEAGTYYWIGGAFECDSGYVTDSYTLSPTTDMGFGEAIGYAVDYVYDGSLVLEPSFYSTAYAGPYLLSVDVVEL